MYTEEFYDSMVGGAFVNLYTLSKNQHSLYLTNINRKDERHLCILTIAKMVQDTYGVQTILCTSWFNFYLLNVMTKCKKWAYRKNIKKVGNVQLIDIEEFIKNLETSNNCPNIYKEIYNAYYNVKGV